VSILNRLRLHRHLDDAALAAIWTDCALGSGPVLHPHFQECAPCRTRFDAFSGWLEGLRIEATAEASDVFTAERLATQQAQIFRRIEAAERPARVIAFPRFSQPLTSRSSGATRWIAAAAAAGLIVGVGVGQMMDFRHAVGPRPITSTVARQLPPAVERPVPAVRTVSTSGQDEVFLSELDASLSRPSVPELRALDDFTPRAGERRK
jgi:hypothetical protein